MKIFLIILAVILVLVITAGVFGFLWVRNNAPALKEKADQAIAEGEAFGQGKQAAECVDESFLRLKARSGLVSELHTQMFMKSCLQVAEVPAEFCTGVPPSSEIMKTVRWSLEQCNGRGMPNSQPCTRLVRAYQEFCENPPPRS